MITPTNDITIFCGPNSDHIQFTAGGKVALEIGPEGFWVDGVAVPQDEAKAKAVYDAFIAWMPIKP